MHTEIWAPLQEDIYLWLGFIATTNGSSQLIYFGDHFIQHPHVKWRGGCIPKIFDYVNEKPAFQSISDIVINIIYKGLKICLVSNMLFSLIKIILDLGRVT